MATVSTASLLVLVSTAPNIFPHSPAKFSRRPPNARFSPFSSALLLSSGYRLKGGYGRRRIIRKRCRLWRVSAVPDEALPAETGVEEARKILPAAAVDGTTSAIVSALLFIAFISLSLLTIGVLYLAIQDFLQKREREMFEKEEVEKKKKTGKKKAPVRAKTGPRGFGQKIEEDDE